MGDSGKQALLFAANLSLPTFQVIAVNANLGCAHCRQRVTQIFSKMAGSKKFTMDMGIKQVIIKGEVGLRYKTAAMKDVEESKLEKSWLLNCVHKLLVRSFGFVFQIKHRIGKSA